MAGSERTSKLECSTDQEFKESCQINNSLLSLGRCLKILKEGKSNLPTRDCTLTLLLMGHLTEGNNVSMLSNVSPDHANVEETIKVLEYASDSNRIVLPRQRFTTIFYSQTKETNKNELASSRQEVQSYQQNRLEVLLNEIRSKIDMTTLNSNLNRWSTNAKMEIETMITTRQSMLSEGASRNFTLSDYLKQGSNNQFGSLVSSTAQPNVSLNFTFCNNKENFSAGLNPIFKNSFFNNSNSNLFMRK